MFRESRRSAAADGAAQGQPGASSGSMLPKLIGVLLLIGLVRKVASHKRGHGDGPSWRDRRREMISELHRELHREDELKADTAEPKKAAATA